MALLSTTLIEIFAEDGVSIKTRALIDSGSMISCFTERLLHRLSLKFTNGYVPIHNLE